MDSGITRVEEVAPPSVNSPKDDAELASEIAARLNIQLKECSVILHRLTEEDIHKSYPTFDSNNEISDDVRSKADEMLDYLSNELESGSSQRIYRTDGHRRREQDRKTKELFARLKRKRQEKKNRKNEATSFNLSGNISDGSEGDFRTLTGGAKGKKKSKRVRKYESDYEWNPSDSKQEFHNDRKLRNKVRRPVIESDSSSDEEDILFNIYMNDDLNHPEYSCQDSVPFEFNHENTVFKSVKDTSRESSSSNNSSEKHDTVIETKNSIQNSESCDVVSSIIKNMNDTHKNMNDARKKPTSFKTPVNKVQSNDVNMNKTFKKERKRLKLASNDKSQVDEKRTTKEVGMVLRRLINTVSEQLRDADQERRKYVKECKWCKSVFRTNGNSGDFCPICQDMEKPVSVNKKASNFGQTKKPLKENKKKCSKTMSQILKKIPKSEMQRLIYADKAEKMSEKGYNHCKSFHTPKDSTNVPQSITASVKVKETKNLKRKSENSELFTNEAKKRLLFTQGTASKIKKNAAKNPENNQKKKGVSLKKYDDGLFLMTFPDRDEELHIPDKIPQSQKTQDEVSKNNLKRPNIAGSNINSSATLNTTLQANNNKDHDTYLFPPIPTVIVSNYSSGTGSLNLSHTYYQNEITHQHAQKTSIVQSSNKVSNEKTLVSISNNASYLKPTISTSFLLSNNSPITITTIPINKGVKQLQSCPTNSVSLLNSKTSVVTNITSMPVISSVMSISQMNISQANAVIENVPLSVGQFNSSNFSNLQITVSKSPSKVTETNLVNQKEISKPSIISMQRKLTNRNSLECLSVKASEQENATNHTSRTQRDREILTRSESTNKLSTETSNLPENKSKSGFDAGNHSLLTDHSNSDKSAENKENINPHAPFGATVIDILDAVSILAVIDLEKNPQSGLNVRIQLAKGNLAKLTSEENVTPELNKKIAECQNNIQLLNIAKKYLSLYGSFTKVSNFLLRKSQMSQMIQIKKEMIEEANQSSCMFSQQSNNALLNNDSGLTNSTEVSDISKEGTSGSCKLTNQAAVNHIEKLQSQIAAMNNAQLTHYGIIPTSGTIHHYPVEQLASLPLSAVAPMPVVTPRNDCLVGESRETPSRGSGPRTPARPESAASQSEEQTLVQIKKEQFEATCSPTTQCALSQNVTLPQLSSQMPVVQEMPSLSMPVLPVSNATINLPVSNANQINLHLQSRELLPNRTVTYSNNDYNNNQNCSDILYNIAAKHPMPVTSVASNQQLLNQNRQVLLGQQMFIQNGSGLCTKQAVPSVNTNQYVIRPPPFTTNTGGTVIVNNPQVGQNALLTNVSNQQFYTSNPVSQLCYPPSSQITCMPSNNISTISSPGATVIQRAEFESPENMLCAVCQNQATLRCKQCARVAYCNTTCAKTYWHQKHKMECKPLS